ncbi:endonuclease domain-containing 1 protein-like [Centroberyx affinis]|uniref:endonuclease domain-containing 1 protein-like n=1 Tax=Centroberyx affinis TaxID=166261 RepID=UPI003A5BB4A8
MLRVVFLLLCPLLSKGHVTPFANCPQFFLNGIPPTILRSNNRYQQICQCLLDQNLQPEYFYATLYDTENRIPVYSAYVFQHPHVPRQDKWLIEPQLDGINGACMTAPTSLLSNNIGHRQAVECDYDGTRYDKGHLYPVSHTATQRAMQATFTLTNAAPQDSNFNRGQWRLHELSLVNILGTHPNSFVVTGVVPGNQKIAAGRVMEARYYWSAYCYRDNNGIYHSSGYIGPDQNGRVQTLVLGDLEVALQGFYNVQTFTVFGGQCY